MRCISINPTANIPTATPEFYIECVQGGQGLKHSTLLVATVIFQSQHKMSLLELERTGREKVFLLLPGKIIVESQNMDFMVFTF